MDLPWHEKRDPKKDGQDIYNMKSVLFKQAKGGHSKHLSSRIVTMKNPSRPFADSFNTVTVGRVGEMNRRARYSVLPFPSDTLTCKKMIGTTSEQGRKCFGKHCSNDIPPSYSGPMSFKPVPYVTNKEFYAQILQEIDKMTIVDDLDKTKIREIVEGVFKDMGKKAKEIHKFTPKDVNCCFSCSHLPQFFQPKDEFLLPLVWEGKVIPEKATKKSVDL